MDSYEEHQRLLKDMEDFRKEFESLPPEEAKKRAIEHLHSAGIVDEEGNLTEPYR